MRNELPNNRFTGPPPLHTGGYDTRPARVVEVPGPAASAAGRPLATVRIVADAQGRESLAVTLSKTMVGAATLRGGAPVELVPPRQTGGTWHLDTRPTAARRLPEPGVARFVSSHKVRRDLFIVPRVGMGTAGILDALTFTLGEQLTAGYYELHLLR